MDNTNVNASKEIPQQTKPSSFQMHQQKRSFVSSNPLPSQVATQSPKLHPLISPFRQSTPRLTFASFIVPNCPLKDQRSSTDIKDRSIPERVIHYIACGRFHDMNSIVKKIVVEGLPVDVLPQLAREKIREAVYEVAEVFLDKLTLLPKYYDKVDRNWPFFTAADRINVNQALLQTEPVVKRPYGPVRAYRRGPLANPKPDYVIVDKFNRTIGYRDKDDNPRQRKRRFPYSPSVMSLLSSEDNSPSDEIPCITLDDDDDEVPDVVDTNLRVPEAVRTADETLHSRFDSCSNSKKSSDSVSVDMLTELTSKSAKKTSEQLNEDNAKEKEPNLECIKESDNSEGGGSDNEEDDRSVITVYEGPSPMEEEALEMHSELTSKSAKTTSEQSNEESVKENEPNLNCIKESDNSEDGESDNEEDDERSMVTDGTSAIAKDTPSNTDSDFLPGPKVYLGPIVTLARLLPRPDFRRANYNQQKCAKLQDLLNTFMYPLRPIENYEVMYPFILNHAEATRFREYEKSFYIYYRDTYTAFCKVYQELKCLVERMNNAPNPKSYYQASQVLHAHVLDILQDEVVLDIRRKLASFSMAVDLLRRRLREYQMRNTLR